MGKFKTGELVTVTLKRLKHPGVVIAVSSGYVMCRIRLEPTWNYGETWLDPTQEGKQIVCVKESDVRHADAASTPKLSSQ